MSTTLHLRPSAETCESSLLPLPDGSTHHAHLANATNTNALCLPSQGMGPGFMGAERRLPTQPLWDMELRVPRPYSSWCTCLWQAPEE